MDLVDPTSVVQSPERLTSIFGGWPSFHDAEVMELSLMRGDVDPDRGRYDFPILTASFLLVESISAQVILRFTDVSDLKLSDFNHCNQIIELSFAVQDRGSFMDGSALPPYVIVEFKGGFGISAKFRCFGVEVVEATRI
jgi:hypothetical protein